ncbi:MAG: FkbM family methyltransferase [Candidatus Omnitrophica bacterium]|nr:FkbM family methyltransferase [Candidatus Omnitrophota bacterium]
MCAKLNQVLSRLLPEGTIKERLKSSYYSLYYNRKHFKENNFRVYYKDGHFEYKFDEGVTFSSYENMTDELKRSLKGYLAKYSLKPGDTVIDCGAYIGEFTLYAGVAVGASGKVIAFEPDAGIYKKLLTNIELNGLKNVITVNKGLWSKDGVMKFVGDNIKGYSFMFAENIAGAVDTPVVSLDNELARLEVTHVNFIKADIEGAELEFIKGAVKTLGSGDVKIAIASYHKIDGRKSFLELEKMLTQLGYNPETSHPGHLTTYASK